jgi:murein DD-endopeptidase MepM/ murein hydrolase activator NlpD
MRLPSISVAVLAWLLGAGPASACELPAAGAGTLALKTARPVSGADARFVAGFGMRTHPLLRTPRMHLGIDWAAPSGTPVVAPAGGRVVEAGAHGEYGNAMLIDHGGGWHTFYAQLSRFAVAPGDCVAAGAEIAYVGSTGLSAGPHLHFEVRHQGKHLDPMLFRPAGEKLETDGGR